MRDHDEDTGADEGHNQRSHEAEPVAHVERVQDETAQGPPKDPQSNVAEESKTSATYHVASK